MNMTAPLGARRQGTTYLHQLGVVALIATIALLIGGLFVSCAPSAHATPTPDSYGSPGLTPEELGAEPPVPLPGVGWEYGPPPEEEEGDEQEAIDPWGRTPPSPPRIWSADPGQDVAPRPIVPSHPECTGICA